MVDQLAAMVDLWVDLLVLLVCSLVEQMDVDLVDRLAVLSVVLLVDR